MVPGIILGVTIEAQIIAFPGAGGGAPSKMKVYKSAWLI
jgi:hypothetical protein